MGRWTVLRRGCKSFYKQASTKWVGDGLGRPTIFSEFEKLSRKSSKFQAFTSFTPDRANTKPEKNPPPITSLWYYFSISDKSANFPKKKIPKIPLFARKIMRYPQMVKNTQKFLHWLYFTQKLDIVIFHIFF